MMMKLSAVMLGTMIAMAAGQAMASTPTTQCFGATGRCVFTNLQPYNNGAGQAAYFYCTPSNASDTIYIEDHSCMVGGFQNGGTLTDPGSTVSQYAFAVYEDPHNPFGANINAKDTTSGIPVSCYAGTNGRPVMPGEPNLP